MPTAAEAGPRARRAGLAEVWAARAWNVFNEGRPFAVVYPPLAVAGAALIGAGPGGAIGWGLLAGLVLSAVWARAAFPLRWRALLWAVAVPGVLVLEIWRAPGLLAVGLGGWALFTVVVWGGLYYRLRTGAPWTNPLRFWRLVATDSDPTSGNALEQIPKLMLTLSAIALVAQAPGAGSAARVAAVAAAAAAAGWWAWRRFARARLPRYPDRAPSPPAGGEGTAPRPGPAKRVYVVVIDGCNRDRLRQASAAGRTPRLDRLAAEGTEFLNVATAYPARTVVCFSSMLTGAAPAEHGMRSNFAPRLGVRCESVFDVLERHGRRGRLVGIAHLLDPFGEEAVRTVTSVQPTARLDHSLAAAGRAVVAAEDPDLLVLQLLAADQLGHVRGTRNPEYLDQLADTDERVGEFLDWLEARGALDGAAVIVMADHGQGRGIGGHGHLDWGESPVPYVHWGAGARAGTVDGRPASVLELAATICALLGLPAPAGARGAPLLAAGPTPGGSPAAEGVPSGQEPADDRRALAILPARDEAPRISGVIAGLPRDADGVPLDVLVVDDGSTDETAARARDAGAEVVAHTRSRGVGAALRTGLATARERGVAACLLIDADGEYEPAHAGRVLAPILAGRADYVLGSRFLGRREGMTWHRALANRAASSLTSVLIGGHVLTDAQTGCRAFSPRAMAAAEIRHDYNHAQVVTLALWGQGILPLEVPVDYRRRTEGRSFVRYPEYARRVVPAVLRQWRHSYAARRTAAAAASTSATDAHAEPVPNRGSSPPSGPHGAEESAATSPPPPSRSSR